MIYVVGDSHSRSFANNANFLPLFIGPGKENCFISDLTLNHVKKNVSVVLNKIPDNSQVLLVLGEPDTRYYLGQGWTPWISNEEYNSINECIDKLESSAQRYAQLISWLKTNFNHDFYVFNVTPSLRKKQNEYVRQFNILLKDACRTSDISFIDIEPNIFINSVEINAKFMGDEVHLNNKMQPFVEDIFIKHGVIQDSKFNKDFNFDAKEVQEHFEFNERFACYVYKINKNEKNSNILKTVCSFFRKRFTRITHE